VSLRVVQIRYDSNGKRFIALQGQTDEEAHEMNRKDLEKMHKAAAVVLNNRFSE
jgi:hypothetical protein